MRRYCSEFFNFLKNNNYRKNQHHKKLSDLFWIKYRDSLPTNWRKFHEHIYAHIPYYFLKKYSDSLKIYD